MADASWSLSVPTRHVDADGTATVIAQVTDTATGQTGTVTVTLTTARALMVVADGITLADYSAWSTT